MQSNFTTRSSSAMKIFAMIILLILCKNTASWAQAKVIAKNKDGGVIVAIKEKYGGTVYDTCTVVMRMANSFVLVHREGVSGWYPISFHSIRIVGMINQAGPHMRARTSRARKAIAGNPPTQFRRNALKKAIQRRKAREQEERSPGMALSVGDVGGEGVRIEID